MRGVSSGGEKLFAPTYKMMKQRHHIVIGGGIAGLCTAWHLVQQGQIVTLIEQATTGSQTSSRAAGMITPASEIHMGESAITNLFFKSVEYYDSFINALTHAQPALVDYQKNGSLMCATNPDGQQDIARNFEFQKQLGFDVRELSRAEIADMEPHLSHRITYAVFANNEACVDHVKLIGQLKKNLLASKLCTLMENTSVTEINIEKESFAGVLLNKARQDPLASGALSADTCVLTTGVSHNIKNLEPFVILPLRPVKGQLVEIKGNPQTISRPVRVYHRYPMYLVPRSDGRIVIGASKEELPDENVTAGVIMDLIYAAWLVLPQIYDWPLLKTTAGLRPTTPDHKPVVGKTSLKNLYVLNGLYRHGIMASPFLAKELVNLILEKTTTIDLTPFSLERFYEKSQS